MYKKQGRQNDTLLSDSDTIFTYIPESYNKLPILHFGYTIKRYLARLRPHNINIRTRCFPISKPLFSVLKSHFGKLKSLFSGMNK